MSAQERFEHDPIFNSLVNSLIAAIEKLDLTPTEIREAAMLAALKHEQHRRSVYERIPGMDQGHERKERSSEIEEP